MGKGIRHWISFVAMFSVLLHVALLIGHSDTVLSAVLANPALDYSALCGDIALDDFGDEGLPGPNKNGPKCPICMGAAPAVALADVALPVLDVPELPGPTLSYSTPAPAPCTIAPVPPSRGPPAAA